MTSRRWSVVIGAALLVCAPALGAKSQNAAGVPQDLKPLLAKPASEVRLIVTRYNADRQELNRNYAGRGGFNMPNAGRRGGGPPAQKPTSSAAAAGAAPR
jgi:hypothetical protein